MASSSDPMTPPSTAARRKIAGRRFSMSARFIFFAHVDFVIAGAEEPSVGNCYAFAEPGAGHALVRASAVVAAKNTVRPAAENGVASRQRRDGAHLGKNLFRLARADATHGQAATDLRRFPRGIRQTGVEN